ncbi:MAG: thiamine pyrophosphate-binding protein [Boseongicola sp. SB0670_bin_30]|nr:thiamine pyrophosphate-binding protein [Boseongicola sp. SB0670_bin_30]
MPNQGTRAMNGGEAIVEMLRRFDVDTMFGLPGEQTHIHDAIFRRNDIRHLLVRHEQAAAKMADSHARATGKVGVCDATVGPGATNLISGISESFLSGIPVVAIVSDVRADWRGRESFQEVDQTTLFRPITKKVFSVDHVERIPEFVKRAFQIATTGRPGPVLLSFPMTTLRAQHEFAEEDLEVDTRYARWPAHRPTPPRREISAAVDAILSAKRPIILGGGGVMASGATDEVRELAELLDMPVATSYMGKGSLPENHPLSLGPYGLLGRTASNEYVLRADLGLALGTRFNNVGTAAWRIPDRKTRLVQVDIEPTQIGRNYTVDLALTGDIRAVLREMLDLLKSDPRVTPKSIQRNSVSAISSNWRKEKGIESPLAQDRDARPVHPIQVIRAMRDAMQDDDVLVCDSGFNQIWGGQYFEVRSPGRNYLGPRGFGVMGYGLPAAISRALTTPDQNVVCLTGDGGFAMVVQELETAVRSGANLTVVVMNNSNMHFIKDNQRLFFDGRYISTEFTELDYAEIARAFGCAGLRVENSGDLDQALAEAMRSDKTSVIDVRILDDAVPERVSLQSFK